MSGRREGPLLRPGGAMGALAWLSLAGVSLIVCLTLVVGLAAVRYRSEGGLAMAGEATIVVHASALESADAAAARAAELLAGQPQVARAWPQSPARVDGLTARLIDGRSSAGESRLVAVDLRPGAAADPAALTRLLTAEGLAASLDDHGPRSGPVERAILFAAIGGGAVLVLAVLLVAAISAGAARTRARSRWEDLDLLRLSGAAERSVAALFGGAAAGAALGAGGVGAILAVGGLVMLHARNPWPTVPVIAWQDLVVAVAWPLAAALVAAVAAVAAVRALLVRAP